MLVGHLSAPLPSLREMIGTQPPPKSRREAFDQIDELRLRLATLLDMPPPPPIARSTRWPPFAWLCGIAREHQAALLVFQRLVDERQAAPSTGEPTSAST
jgi:hypothetical protein